MMIVILIRSEHQHDCMRTTRSDNEVKVQKTFFWKMREHTKDESLKIKNILKT